MNQMRGARKPLKMRHISLGCTAKKFTRDEFQGCTSYSVTSLLGEVGLLCATHIYLDLANWAIQNRALRGRARLLKRGGAWLPGCLCCCCLTVAEFVSRTHRRSRYQRNVIELVCIKLDCLSMLPLCSCHLLCIAVMIGHAR